MKVPDEVFNQICADMDARERAGEFDRLFKEEIKPSDRQISLSSYIPSKAG